MATKAKDKVKPNFMGIEGANLARVRFEFYQDSDCCQDQDEGQSLVVETDNGGGGSYVIISTERWAMDNDHVDKFADCLKRIVALPED